MSDNYDQINLIIKELRKTNQNLEKISNNLGSLSDEIKGIKSSKLLFRIENFLRNKLWPRLTNKFSLTTTLSRLSRPLQTKLSVGIKPNNAEITVISWDLAHNACGRAYWLAEALSETYQVEVFGIIHKRFGNKLWKAISQLPIVSKFQFVDDSDWNNAKAIYYTFGKQIESDIIICCKFIHCAEYKEDLKPTIK